VPDSTLLFPLPQSIQIWQNEHAHFASFGCLLIALKHPQPIVLYGFFISYKNNSSMV